MNYTEIYNTFLELKKILEDKKLAIINKDLEKLNSIDEMCIIISNKINDFKIPEIQNQFSKEEKENLKKLGVEIKAIEENNEILIKHSLDVINNTLSGILNIAQNDKTSYNARGLEYQHSESLDISSITEEA